MHDFRSFLEQLDSQGNLVRIQREVDSEYELAAVMSALDKQGKAYVIENVKGARMPLVGGLLNSPERFGEAMGLDGDSTPDHRLTAAIVGKAQANPVDPVTVDSAPCQEVIKQGDDIDLGELPVPRFFEFDSGNFITGAVGITHNEETGRPNVGFYRTQVMAKDDFVINASSMSDLRKIYDHARDAGKSMPIALALGVDPVLLMAAAAKPLPGNDEFQLAGALKGKPMELVKCVTSDLMVPANAEIIIEGEVDFSRNVENTLGEFAAQYGPETAPVTRITAITHRRDPMFYSIMAGLNPEHNTIGVVAMYGIRHVIATSLKEQFPNIQEINVACVPRLGPMVHMFISIDKQSDEEPGELLKAAFAATAGFFPVEMITKRIVVVDSDVDVYDLDDVEWATWTRIAEPERFHFIPDALSWELERCADENSRSVRVGIDATMSMKDTEKLVKPRIVGYEDLNINDYLP